MTVLQDFTGWRWQSLVQAEVTFDFWMIRDAGLVTL